MRKTLGDSVPQTPWDLSLRANPAEEVLKQYLKRSGGLDAPRSAVFGP